MSYLYIFQACKVQKSEPIHTFFDVKDYEEKRTHVEKKVLVTDNENRAKYTVAKTIYYDFFNGEDVTLVLTKKVAVGCSCRKSCSCPLKYKEEEKYIDVQGWADLLPFIKPYEPEDGSVMYLNGEAVDDMEEEIYNEAEIDEGSETEEKETIEEVLTDYLTNPNRKDKTDNSVLNFLSKTNKD
jgi:hypothetical protein